MKLVLEIIGNIGNDATINESNGKKVINFSVAHTEKFKDANGTEKSSTTWVDAEIWTDKTNVAQYLKKGTQVSVTGKPRVSMYQDKERNWKASLKLRVNTGGLILLGAKKENSSNGTASVATPQPVEHDVLAGDPVDDLPF